MICHGSVSGTFLHVRKDPDPAILRGTERILISIDEKEHIFHPSLQGCGSAFIYADPDQDLAVFLNADPDPGPGPIYF